MFSSNITCKYVVNDFLETEHVQQIVVIIMVVSTAAFGGNVLSIRGSPLIGVIGL